MYSRKDIQVTSDIRLMALSLIKMCIGTSQKDPIITSMRKVVRECDEIIEAGPVEFRHVIAETSSPAEISASLRRSAFGARA